jgi:hypothetical protein
VSVRPDTCQLLTWRSIAPGVPHTAGSDAVIKCHRTAPLWHSCRRLRQDVDEPYLRSDLLPLLKILTTS